MRDYTVELEPFSGPMDLLLYLVRRDEVRIEDIRVAELTEQYLGYLDRSVEIDVDTASDFLVMAAQLLQLKARALLPDLQASAGAASGEPPLTAQRLIENLLEYRALQEEAQLLEELEGVAGRRASRISARSVEDIPLRHVDVWDLVTAMRRLAETEAERERRTQTIDQDQEPLYLHVARLRERVLHCHEALRFEEATGDTRATRVAAFLALLELIRLHEVHVRQSGPFGEIWLTGTTAAEREAMRADDALEDAASDDASDDESDGANDEVVADVTHA